MLNHATAKAIAVSLMLLAVSIERVTALQEETTKQEKQNVVVASERIGLSLVIYNQNIALVRDMRRAFIPEGDVVIEFTDVSPNMDFSSVNIASLSAPSSLQVTMQKLLANRPTPAALLEKSIGKTITLIRYAEDGSIAEKIEGQLLSVDGARPATVKVGEKILLYPFGVVVLSEMPEEMVLKPKLIAFAKSSEPRTHNLILTYITTGVNWSVDYNAIVSEEEESMELFGYANVRNDSGISFPYAKVHLLAGTPRVSDRRFLRRELQEFARDVAPAPGGQGVTEAPFFEYHLYDIPQKLTLDEKGSLRIAIVSAKDIKVKKQFIITAPSIGFEVRPLQEKLPTRIVISFINDEEHKLGIPLPLGTVKLHKLDQSGRAVFIGETPIPNIGKGQKVDWDIGTAFDIAAYWKQVKSVAPTAKEREIEVEALVTNGKDKEVTVQLRQPFTYGLDWDITKASHGWKMIDAMTAEFTLQVPPSGKTTVTFTAKVRLRP
ncbi:MAG: hypothetical protein RUDDFDWM_001414 [Candidatus Fervidibacterota bacterium]